MIKIKTLTKEQLKSQIIETTFIFYMYFIATFGFLIYAVLTGLTISWIGFFAFLIMSMGLFLSSKLDRFRLEHRNAWEDYLDKY